MSGLRCSVPAASCPLACQLSPVPLGQGRQCSPSRLYVPALHSVQSLPSLLGWLPSGQGVTSAVTLRAGGAVTAGSRVAAGLEGRW